MTNAEELYARADYLSAAELFRKQIVEESKNALAYEGLARCLYKLGEFDNAWDQAIFAIKLNPDSTHAYLVLSTILFSKGEYLQAEQMARKAVESDPTMWEGLNNLASTLDALGKPEESLLFLSKAVSLAPDDWRPHFSISIMFNKLKQHAQSYEEAKKAFRIHPSGQTGYLLIRTFISAHKLIYIITFAAVAVIAPALAGATSVLIKLLLITYLLLWEVGEMLYGNKNRGKRGVVIVLILGIVYLIFGHY